MTTSYFEYATRNKLRFKTPKGFLSVEYLWDLPLTSNSSEPNLDDIARSISVKMKNETTESFVEDKPSSDIDDEVKLEVVKAIIAHKLKEREARRDAVARKERKKQLLTALAEKRADTIANLTEEAILAELDTLP